MQPNGSSESNPYKAPRAPGTWGTAADSATGDPTRIRFFVIAATTLASLLMYLDRVCVSEIAKLSEFQTDLQLDANAKGLFLSSFFLVYALAQVPSGFLSDRFGARSMMTLYIALWSLFTGLTGMATGLATLLVARVGCGLAQAGAYPTSSGLVGRWIPLRSRGMASGIVTFGGRAGSVIAPFLTIAMIQLTGWRSTLVIYGVAGVFVAGLFWFVFRERPERHPWVNAAECQLILEGRPAVPAGDPPRREFPWRPILLSRSLWCMSLAMFMTNIGWAFLVTWLPTYLMEAKHVLPTRGGLMATLALLGGVPGVLLGGLLTDWALRRFGLRWGRGGPMVASRFLGMLAYLSCLWIDNPWLATAAFATVAFATDLGIGASWAYSQDVGGRHVGAIMGWFNMWGNLGAALMAQVLPKVLASGEAASTSAGGNWDAAFLLGAAAFALSGLASLGVRADIPLAVEVEANRD